MRRCARRWAAWPGLLLVAGLAAGCAQNPATGEQQFVLMSDEEAAETGAEQHPKILERFGGAYDDPDLAAYVSRVGQKVAAESERADVDYTFTVLDSPIANAMALPGGYIYVTRGLLALMNDEAELAALLGHEIGHVVARHSNEQMAQQTTASIGAVLVGVALGSEAATRLANVGAEAYVASYSRDQELEADRLGLRYASAAGYHADGMADTLRQLLRQRELRQTLAGQGGGGDMSIFASHPNPEDRIARQQALLAERSVAGAHNRDALLDRLDGLAYGGAEDGPPPAELDVVALGPGQDFDDLAAAMPVEDHAGLWLRTLNGLDRPHLPDDRDRVKLLVR